MAASETSLPQPVAPTTLRSPLFDAPLFWFLALLVLGVLSPLLPVPSFAIAIFATVTLTIAHVYFVVQFAVQATRKQWSIAVCSALLVASIVLWWLLENQTKPLLQGIFRSYGRDLPFGWQLLGLVNMTTRSLCLLVGGVFGGAIVARLIKNPNMVGPVCAIVALIDIWGVLFGGIVSKLLTNPASQPLAEKAMASLPTIGGAASGSRFSIPAPAIGIGDFLFLGLFFFALHALDMNWRDAAKWITPFISIALLAITLGLVPFLPGLVPIGLGVAIPNIKYFQFTRDEKFALIWAGVLVVILTAVLYFVIVSQLPK